MCEHFHVMGAAATPQPGYAIHYLECIVFTSLLHHNRATSYYNSITISHQEEKNAERKTSLEQASFDSSEVGCWVFPKAPLLSARFLPLL